MQRAYAKLPGLFVFLKQPFKKPKLMKSKSGKDLTSLALCECLSSVGMKACPEHPIAGTESELRWWIPT